MQRGGNFVIDGRPWCSDLLRRVRVSDEVALRLRVERNSAQHCRETTIRIPPYRERAREGIHAPRVTAHVFARVTNRQNPDAPSLRQTSHRSVTPREDVFAYPGCQRPSRPPGNADTVATVSPDASGASATRVRDP